MAEGHRYNGWTNYETWAVNLWMDNDEGSQSFWAETTQETYHAARATSYSTKVQAAASDLATLLKEHHEENAPDLGACVYSDLLNAALSEVNWHEIAESLIEDQADEMGTEDEEEEGEEDEEGEEVARA